MAARKSAEIKEKATTMAANAGSVVITQPKTHSVILEVTGTAGLIQNCFGQKAVEEMLRKHMGHSVQREKKVPRNVLENALIKNEEGRICIPPMAFKMAMLTASTQVKGFKKTQLRIAMWVFGQSIPITYEENVPRMDMVRLAGMGRTPDVRFRPMFTGWKARLAIQYSELLSAQTVVDLLHRAGQVGVGEWRPERNGTFGTFTVTRSISSAEEIKEVHKECAVPLVSLKIPDWAMDLSIDPAVLQSMFSGADDDKDDPRAPTGEGDEVTTLEGEEALRAAERESESA